MAWLFYNEHNVREDRGLFRKQATYKPPPIRSNVAANSNWLNWFKWFLIPAPIAKAVTRASTSPDSYTFNFDSALRLPTASNTSFRLIHRIYGNRP